MGWFKQSGPEGIPGRRTGPSRLCPVSGAGWTQTPRCQPLKGFGAKVLEVVSRREGDTYRTVYTVRFKAAIYVLHAFQKKAKQGIATPTSELELVRRRLKAAQEHYADTYGER